MLPCRVCWSFSTLAITLAEVGPAIVFDAASIGLGFAVLLLSQVPANARLAGLLVLCVWHCMAATFLLVPALVKEKGA